jgi:hypothetical protein
MSKAPQRSRAGESYVRRTLGLAKSTMWLQEPRDGIPTGLRELGIVEGAHHTSTSAR